MKHTLIAVALMSSFSVANATNNDFVGMGAYQEDQARQDAAIHQIHMNTLTKYSESWGLEDRANIAKLQETKLDKSVFTADQQRQDKALADVVTKQSATDAKQTTDLKSYADKKATSAYTTSVAHTDAKVARADADRKAGDDALSTRIDNNQANQSDRKAGQDTHINAVQEAAQIANDRVGNVEVRSDVLENGVRETNERVKVTDSRSINNAVRIDSVEQIMKEIEVGCEAIVINSIFPHLAGKSVKVEEYIRAGQHLPAPLQKYYVAEGMWYVWFHLDKVAGVIREEDLIRIDGNYDMTDSDRIDFYREWKEW